MVTVPVLTASVVRAARCCVRVTLCAKLSVVQPMINAMKTISLFILINIMINKKLSTLNYKLSILNFKLSTPNYVYSPPLMEMTLPVM